jgi:hypothetical protein
MIESVQLTATEKEDVIRNVIGLVQRLYGEDLPDDFNVQIRVRSRFVKRLDIHPVVKERAIVEPNVFVRK